ncbi:MAG: hypothetical protein Q9218_006788 [Villophora microphyllina]
MDHHQLDPYLELPSPEVFRSELPSPEIFHPELPSPEPFFSSELSAVDPTLVPELTSSELSHELPTPDPYSYIHPISHRDDPVDNGTISLPNDASLHPETPRPTPHAEGLDTVRKEYSTHNLLARQAKFSFLKGPSESHAQYPSELVHVKPNVTGRSAPSPSRRSEHPRLSLVTTHSSSHESGHPTSAVPSQRNTRGNNGMKNDPAALPSVGVHPQMVGTSATPSYTRSSIYPTLFNRPIPAEAESTQFDALVSPSSASSAVDSPPFDRSAFKSPTVDRESYIMQNPSENHPINPDRIPLAPDSFPHWTHLHGEIKYGVSAPREHRISRSTSSLVQVQGHKESGSSDSAAIRGMSATEHLLRDLTGRVIYLHHQCTSTLDRNTERTRGIFGSSGYAAFKHGLRVLRKVYSGSIPCTSDAICALVQVALQCASCLPSQASDHLCGLIRSDISRWSLAIEDENSKDSFLEAMNILLANWQLMQKSPSEVSITPHALGTKALPCAHRGQERPCEFANAQLSRADFPVNRCSFEQCLKEGAIIQLSSRFLDEFECLKLAERDSATPVYPPDRIRTAADNYKFLMYNIIDPLLRNDLFSSLRQEIATVEQQLRHGVLYHVREVEVMLMHYGLALFPGSESCRKHQYCVDIGQMQAISQELEKQEAQKTRTERATTSWNNIAAKISSTTHPVQSAMHRSTGAPSSKLRTLKPALKKTGNASTGHAGSLLSGSSVASNTTSSCPSTPASSLFSIVTKQKGRRCSTLNTSVDGTVSSSPTSSDPSKTDESPCQEGREIGCITAGQGLLFTTLETLNGASMPRIPRVVGWQAGTASSKVLLGLTRCRRSVPCGLPHAAWRAVLRPWPNDKLQPGGGGRPGLASTSPPH